MYGVQSSSGNMNVITGSPSSPGPETAFSVTSRIPSDPLLAVASIRSFDDSAGPATMQQKSNNRLHGSMRLAGTVPLTAAWNIQTTSQNRPSKLWPDGRFASSSIGHTYR